MLGSSSIGRTINLSRCRVWVGRRLRTLGDVGGESYIKGDICAFLHALWVAGKYMADGDTNKGEIFRAKGEIAHKLSTDHG